MLKKVSKIIASLIMLTTLGLVASATGLQTVTDYAVRSPGKSNQELVSSVAVPGGTLYTVATMNNGVIVGSPSTAFVPVGAAAPQRYMRITDAKSASGVPLTTSVASGVPAVSRVAGSSLYLVGETVSGVAATDRAIFELVLPDSYVDGSDITATINANYVLGTSGVASAAATTMTLNAYTESNGVEAALTTSAAQRIPATSGDLAFTITGTGLTPGMRIMLELVMLVTSTANNVTGHINSVAVKG